MTLAAIIGLLVVAWAVYAFNRLTQLRQLGDNAWADIDVQLKRRHDLIPNVVAVVQGHAGYERSTLEARSEERRVGKECGARREAWQCKKEEEQGAGSGVECE